MHDSDPDDPVEILHTLPEEHHAQFLAEYTTAVEGARRPEEFRQLHARSPIPRLDIRPGEHAADFAPAEQVIPGRPGSRTRE